MPKEMDSFSLSLAILLTPNFLETPINFEQGKLSKNLRLSISAIEIFLYSY